MPPNPRVVMAFRAMKELGIAEDAVKPVLKDLLRAYEKNWELIEEDNYRVLADAIFDQEDNKKVDQTKIPEINNVNNVVEDVRKPDEFRRTSKKFRLKYQDHAGEDLEGYSGGSSSKRSKNDNRGPPGTSDPQQHPEKVNSSKGKHHASSKSLVVRESCHLKEPKSEPGLDIYTQKEVPSTVTLIKPKDEPFTDDLNNKFSGPITVIPPEKRNVLQIPEPLSGNGKSRGDGLLTSSDDTGNQLASVSQVSCGSMDIASISIGDIQISMKCNYVGRPGFHTPNLDGVMKLVEDKCRSAYNVDSSFSVAKLMTDICNACVELGSGTASEPQKQDSQRGPVKAQEAFTGKVNEETVNAGIPADLGSLDFVASEFLREPVPLDVPTDSIHTDQIGAVCGDRSETDSGKGQDDEVPGVTSPLEAPSALVHQDQNGLINSDGENEKISSQGQNDVTSEIKIAADPADAPSGFLKATYDADDITKGQEKVKISLVNEVDSTPPPPFFYVPRNIIFQKAYVDVSLARIGDVDCCPDCDDDCLSAKIPCACALETGGEFAYTSDGLVKESILEECISMNRDPKKHCQFYCKDKECPIERSKSGDMVEPCKGHLVRKFIKECWSKCGCGRYCGNRLVQRGITRNLQVFMTPKGKGWGLRTLEDLPKGAFVCEYVGEILTNAELFERNMKNTLKHSYPVLLDADWASEKVLKDEEALCLDATTFGNVARFINHRCFDSNMVEIPVEVETPDRHYYRLAFFTTRDVAAMEELTWDYGIDFDDRKHPVKAFRCSCGSKFCRNMKRPRRRRIYT
uniref:SET domain-containing protein n=1 Tax=Kalanchoe fedtschenkoi TaxID=63787 RepID=A0A7N0U8S0_KALFE